MQISLETPNLSLQPTAKRQRRLSSALWWKMNINNEEEKYNPPKRSTGDAVHAVVRAGLGAIPLAGAAATELLNLMVLPNNEYL